MKKILFGLVASVVFACNASAQEPQPAPPPPPVTIVVENGVKYEQTYQKVCLGNRCEWRPLRRAITALATAPAIAVAAVVEANRPVAQNRANYSYQAGYTVETVSVSYSEKPDRFRGHNRREARREVRRGRRGVCFNCG